MINLPAYSGAALAALIFSNLFLLVIFFVAAGPVFITGRDAFGRPLENIGIVRRVLFMIMLLGFCVYVAVQAVAITKFLPYFLDPGQTEQEKVTSTTEVTNNTGAAIAYWITTERHRFGVSEEIFHSVATGDVIEVRYRPVDDTLYELHIVRRHNEPVDNSRP